MIGAPSVTYRGPFKGALTVDVGLVMDGRAMLGHIWVVPKIKGPLLGVPIIRMIVFWGLYCGPPILGSYHLGNFRGSWGPLKSGLRCLWG